MADSNAASGAGQRIAPSTAYTVEGNPDDYRYVFRGADLVLIDANNQEQVFMFVGNIMSLDGSVNMQFGDGSTLNSQELFSRSEIQDMEQLDGESVEWEIQADGNSSPENSEGNSADGTGLLPPAEQNDAIPAQAPAPPADPTDAILEMQRKLISELSERSEGDNLPAPPPDASGKPDPGKESAKEAENPLGEAETEGTKPGTGTGSNTEKPNITLTAATDSGLQGDSVTKDLNPEFQGTALADATVEIFVDNVLVETVTADATGAFTTSGVGGLAHGDHRVHASSANSDGVIVESSPFDLVIDRVAPDLPTLQLSVGSNTGTVNDGNVYTNDTTPRLQGTGGDPESTVRLSYSSDNINYEYLATVDVGSDGSWDYTMTDADSLEDGKTYTFRVTSEDHAGNEASGFTELTDVIVDTSNPTSSMVLSAASDSIDEDAGGTVGDGLTNAETLTLEITASADTTSVEIFRVDGGYISLGLADKVGGNWVFTVDNADVPADGTYKFVEQATDVAGNVEIIQSKYALEIAIDRTVPVIAPTIHLNVTSDSADTVIDGQIGDHIDDYTNADVLKFDGKIGGDEDGMAGTVKLYVSVDGGAEIELDHKPTLNGLVGGQWTYELDLSDIGLSGSNDLEFTVKVFDAAGNVSESDLTVHVDRTNPDIPSIGLANLQGTLDPDITEDVATVRNTDAVLEGVITEGSDDLVLTVYQVNGDGSRTAVANNMADNGALGDVSVTDNGDGTYAWSYDYGAIADGQSYTFVATAEDKAGNFSDRESKTFVINADTSIDAPTIELDSSTDTAGGPNGSVGDDYTGYKNGNENVPLKINVSGDDNSTIDVYLVDDTAPGAQAIVSAGVTVGTGVLVKSVEQDSNDDWPLVPFDASAYDGTTTTLTFIAVSTDVAGNSKYTEYTMTLDDENPVAGDIDLDVTDDFGVSDTDNITNAKQILLSGTLEEGDTAVKVTIFDGGVELGEATVTTVGGVHSWTFDIGDETSVDFADFIATGDHSYTAVVEDNAGNQTTLTALPVVIDRDIATPTFTLNSGSDSGLSDSDGITKDASLVFDGSSDLGDTVVVHKVDELGNVKEVDTFTADTDWSGLVDNGDGSASWTYTVESSEVLGDGDYSFYVTTTDAAGNSKESSHVDVDIDRTTNKPGDIDLVDASDSSYADGSFTAGTANDDDTTYVDNITLTGSVAEVGVEAGSVLNLYIQGIDDPIKTITLGSDDTSWSITVPKTTIPNDIAYDFYVKYVDLAGNTSAASDDLEVTIDRTKPVDPTIALNGDEGTDYFDHGGDIYTNEKTPTFTIDNLEADTVLNIKVDGQSVATPDGVNGSLSFNPATFTVEGIHTVSVVAVDVAGNASNEITYTFNLDSVAGDISGVKLADTSNTGAIDDTLTFDTTPEIVGVAEANSSVFVKIMNGAIQTDSATVTADADGKWSYQMTNDSLLEDGVTYTVDVTATDYAGNEATDDSYTFKIDTSIEPVYFGMDETEANDPGFAWDDHHTNIQNPKFSWTAQESLKTTISVYKEDGSLLESYDLNFAENEQSWVMPDSLDDGIYTVKAAFTDVAGNIIKTDASGESVIVTIDTQAPALSVELADASDSGVENDWITNDEEVADGLGLSGTAEAGTRLSVYVNDMVSPISNVATGGNNYITVGADGKWTFDLSGLDIGSGINVGDNIIKVIAEDMAGNKTTRVNTLEIDPAVDPVNEILLDEGSNSGYKDDFITNDMTPLLTGSTEADSTVVISLVVGGVANDIGTADIDADGNWTFLVPGGTLLTDGDYTFRATITDKAANTATTDRVITIDTDPMVPTIAMSEDTAGEFFGTDSDFVTSDTTPQFSVTTEVGTRLEIFRGGVSIHTVAIADNMGDGVLVFPDETLSEGTYVYRFHCTDTAGNTSETTQTVVIDPQYDPADLTVTLDSGYDSGILDTDGLTNETRPLFTGTAEEGSRVQVYFSEKYDSEAEASAAALPGTPKSTVTLAAGETDWEYTPSELTSDGFYKLTVVSEDEAGNQQTKTSIIELDATPPVAPTFELTEDGGNTIISASQTEDNTPGFAGTGEAGSTVTIAVYALATNELVRSFEATVDGSGNWFRQVEAEDSLADGPYNVVVSSADDAGNTAAYEGGFQITGADPAPPTITLLAADDSNIDTDGITNQNVNLTLTGIAQSYCDVEVYRTNTGGADVLIATVEAAGNGTWSTDLAGPLADGSTSYYAKSEYSIGNWFTSDTFELEVDTETVNPTLNLADDTGVTDDWLDPNDTDTDWETSNATITGVVDEGSTVRIQATNTTTNAVTTVTIDPENLTKVGDVWSYSHDLSALGDGEYSIVVSSLDVAGNAGISVTETMTLDTAISKPTLDLPDLLDTELNVGAGGEILFPNGTVAGPAMLSHLPGDFVTNEIDGYTRNNSLPLSGQAEPGSLVRITITKEGEAYPSPDVFVVTSDTGDWTYPTGVLPDGLYTFAVTSIDTAGNESQADALNVYVDAVPSRSAVITMADGIDSNNSTNDTSDTTPTFTLYGDSDSTYLLYLDGQADPVATGTFNSSSYTRITPDDLVANMDHTYKLVTVDRAGNVQVTNDFNFTIDTIAPEQQDNPIAVTGSSTIIDAVGADPMKIYTNDNDPTMTIKVEAGTQAYMTGFNNNEWLTDTDGDGFITFNIANILEEGSHSASVMFRDAAHNRDANEDLSFDLVVDTNKPATNIDLKRSSDLGFSNSDDVTSGDQLVLMGTILETGLGQADGDFTSDIADYSVVVTNTTAGTSETVSSDDITLNADGTWELTYGTDGTDLSSGDYTATLTAADLSGNTHSSSTSFTVDNDDANILHDPAVSLQEIGSSGYYILQEANYLPDGVDMSHYKYELTFYGKDGDGNNISLALGESSFNGDGGIEELVTPSIMSTYDHAGVKVIDYAGNETESDFLDLDATDVTFVAEVEASADISSINVSITGDTDGDNVDDVSLSAEVNVDGDGNWMFQFLANPLAEGEYTLHLEGLDSASDPVSVAGESTYDFSVLASELQSDEQEFSIGENPSGETPPVGGADGDIATDSVEIEASVHIDYVEGSIS